MLTAVIAYSDRIPDNEYFSKDSCIGIFDFCARGNYNRTLLDRTVQGLHRTGIDEIIVVNYANPYDKGIKVRNAKVINAPDPKGFSEWNAKLLGIKESTHQNIITLNADIIVNSRIIRWFIDSVSEKHLMIYQGTKLWMDPDQTQIFLNSGKLIYCDHEVIIDQRDGTEFPVCGFEPSSWEHRRTDASRYLKIFGLDCWKNSGDFQAFNKAVLDRFDYPTDLYGWGWGDIEIRLRAKEAGLEESWNTLDPVFHLHHPITKWNLRKAGLLKNVNKCKRDISFELLQIVAPPLHNERNVTHSSECHSFNLS